jgi:phosphoglycerate dehydrogenase-like enzyme
MVRHNIIFTQPMDLYPDQFDRIKGLKDSLGEFVGYKMFYDMPKDADEWFSRCSEGDIICSGKLGFTEKVNNLKGKFVSVPFVGVSSVDPVKVKKNGSLVSYSPGCNRHAVSEWVIGMAFMLFRRLDFWVNTEIKDEVPEREKGLFGKKVVVLGKGNIGKRVGEMAEAIGMDVNYFCRGDDLYGMVVDADLVVDCLGSNESTLGLLDKKFFSACNKSVFFITITGPKICPLEDLFWALDNGEIAGCAHDSAGIVRGYTDDPFYQKILVHPKVLATPHISYNTDVSNRIAYDMMIDNIEAFLKGKPINVVE